MIYLRGVECRHEVGTGFSSGTMKNIVARLTLFINLLIPIRRTMSQAERDKELSRNSAKAQFLQHSLSVLASHQSSPEEYRRSKKPLPSDHPFYSQYNHLKLKNLLHSKKEVQKLSKTSEKQLDRDCEREFGRFVRYRMDYNNKKMSFLKNC